MKTKDENEERVQHAFIDPVHVFLWVHRGSCLSMGNITFIWNSKFKTDENSWPYDINLENLFIGSMSSFKI